MNIFKELLFLGGYSTRPQDLVEGECGCNLDREEPFEGYTARLGRTNMPVTCDAKRGPPAPRFSAPH